MKRFLLAIATIGIFIIYGSRAGESEKSRIPTPDAAAMMQGDSKFINSVLKQKDIFPADGRKAAGRALMIAALAQFLSMQDKENETWTELRNRGLFVFGALDKRDYAAAKKTIYSKLKSKDANVPKATFTLKHAMHLFASERMGGYGLEGALYKYLDSTDKITAKQFDDIRRLGYRITAISAALPKFAPKKDAPGGKTRKNWLTWAMGLHSASIELSASAKATGDVRAVLEKMNAHCTKCHEAFR